MADVRFPNVAATCVIPGSIVGGSGNITARVTSTAEKVTVTDLTGGNGTVSIEGSGFASRGFFGTRLSASQLRSAAAAARTCASGLRPPERVAVREIAKRFEQLASKRQG